jgi:ABC-type branched-chain amino acid transport systems, periplasmic component
LEALFFDSINIPDNFYSLLNDKNFDILIGPVFSKKLSEIYQVVDHIKIPVLSFSNNKKLKNNNVWLLGKMQEDEIEYIIDFGIKTGINKLAIIGENTEYSKTLIFTAKKTLLNKGIDLDVIIFEKETLNDRSKLRHKVKKISGWKKEFKNKLILPKPRYDGILFTGSNEFILKLAPLLSYYDLNSDRVTYLGNSNFKSSQLVNELSLQGTFFSSSNDPKIDEFKNEWRENWGLSPSYFSILAYDLALFAKKLSLEKDFSNYITRTQGHKWLSGEVF